MNLEWKKRHYETTVFCNSILGEVKSFIKIASWVSSFYVNWAVQYAWIFNNMIRICGASVVSLMPKRKITLHNSCLFGVQENCTAKWWQFNEEKICRQTGIQTHNPLTQVILITLSSFKDCAS